jgi:transposase-like protein
MQLAKEIGITQKSAWFVLHRLREACGGKLDMLRGIVAVDEVWIGGLEKNKHENKRLHAGKAGKSIVLGMRERKGRTKAFVIPNVNAECLTGAIAENVEEGATIHTDESKGYQNLSAMSYQHDTVDHSAKEYVRGDVSTNNIETVWALLKRGLHGVYHHASAKHLGRYVDEFTFRLNEGNVKFHTLERLDSFIDAVVGKRLTYERLTA